MKKLIVLLTILTSLVCLTTPTVNAQSISTTACPGAGCTTISTLGQGSIGIQITGTWSGTITFQSSLQSTTTPTFTSLLVYPSSSITGVTTTTGNGVWTAPIAGINSVRVVFTAYSSGTAVITYKTTTAARNTPGAAGAGSGTVTSIATSSPITGGTITDSGTIACGTCGVTGTGLQQFASTTSAQLAGVISNETGTGSLVFNNAPTFLGNTTLNLLTLGAGPFTDFSSYFAGITLYPVLNPSIAAAGGFAGIDNYITTDSASTGNTFDGSIAGFYNTLSISETHNITNTLLGLGNYVTHENGTVSILTGIDSELQKTGTGNVNDAFALYGFIRHSGSGTFGVGGATAVYAAIENTGVGTMSPLTSAFYVKDPINSGGGTWANYFAFYSAEITANITNPYYLWFDSDGVYRIKQDTAVDGGNGQSIMALYNPRFTKYTPGASNYERVVQEWIANEAVYGVEAGGTGTNRVLKFMGAGLKFSSGLVTPASSGTRYLCISTAGVVTSSASACSGT